MGREDRGCEDAEMADEIDWLDLPGRWTYGVDRGGRIFFIKYVRSFSFFFFPPLKLYNLKGGRVRGQTGAVEGRGGWNSEHD